MDKDNRIIAEFMGAHSDLNSFIEYDLYSCISLGHIFRDIVGGDADAKHFFRPHEMKFNESWDWLMPVVEKIESLYEDGIDVTQYSDGILIENWREQKEIIRLTRAEESYTRIEFTYYAVVEFIKWYNKSN